MDENISGLIMHNYLVVREILKKLRRPERESFGVGWGILNAGEVSAKVCISVGPIKPNAVHSSRTLI